MPFGGLGQAWRQMPQFFTSARRSTSHPFLGFQSQSPKPALQVITAHAPATHAEVAFSSMQALAQAPQFLASTEVSTSQPFA